MNNERVVQRIGKNLRDQTSDIVHAGLPDCVRSLLRKLLSLEASQKPRKPSKSGKH